MTITTPDDLLRGGPAADALTELGFRTSDKTLAVLRCRGGGPPYRKYGRVVLYQRGDLLAWAEGRLSAPRSSTSSAATVA
jgi:hypothetical protein